MIDKANYPKPWTEKQVKFVRHYLADKSRNATAAAIEAGYSPHSAKNQAYRLMTHDDFQHVQTEIQEKTEQILHRLDIKAEDILREYASIAFGNLGNFLNHDDKGNVYVDFSKANHADIKALSKMDVMQTFSDDGKTMYVIRLALHDKLHALNVLERHIKKPKKEGQDQNRDAAKTVNTILKILKKAKENKDQKDSPSGL